MNNSNKDIEIIGAYLLGKLEDKEIKSIEERLANDTAFREEYELQRDLIKHLEETRNKELKQFLVKSEQLQIESDQKANGKSKVIDFKFRSFISYAASILLVISIAWLVYDQVKPKKDLNLYSSYFEVYPNDWQVITRSTTKEDLKYKVMQAYEEGSYQQSLKLINQLVNEEYNDTLSFFKAMNLLNLNRTDEAKQLLESLINKSDWAYIEPTRWYLSLVYLNANETNKARRVLSEIVDSEDDHFQKSSARNLLIKLDESK